MLFKYIVLIEIRRPALCALALITFSLVFYFAVFKDRLHFYFPAAGAKEFLRRAGSTRVFTGLSHSISPHLEDTLNRFRSQQVSEKVLPRKSIEGNGE